MITVRGAFVALMLAALGSSALVVIAQQQTAPPISQSSGGAAAGTPAVLALYGWGSAPACPALWSTLVTQTAAGTIVPLTSTTGVSQEWWTGSNQVTGNSYVPDGSLIASGHTSGVVLSTSTATTYTWYYRICQAP